MNSLSRELKLKYKKYQTAVEIWRDLVKVYGKVRRTVSYNLVEDLVCKRMTDGSSLLLHFVSMMRIMRKYRKRGGQVSKLVEINIVLHSLSDSYNDFIKSLSTRREFTLPELFLALMREESDLRALEFAPTLSAFDKTVAEAKEMLKTLDEVDLAEDAIRPCKRKRSEVDCLVLGTSRQGVQADKAAEA